MAKKIEQAIAIHRTGQIDKAVAVYTEILESEPENSVALHMLGIANHQQGNNGPAKTLITKAIAIDPDFTQAHFNLGVVNQALGNLDEAKVNYQRTIDLDPNHGDAYINLGTICKSLGQLEQAIESFNVARDLKPESLEPYINMGGIFLELEQLDKAEENLRHALQLNPDHAEAHLNLAAALYRQGKLEDARSSCLRSIELNPDFPQNYNTLGSIEKSRGRMSEAAEHFNHAISLKPDFAEAYINLASVQKPDADNPVIKAMESIFKDSATSSTSKMRLAFGLGSILDSTKNYKQAFPYFREANQLKRDTLSFNIEKEEAYTTQYRDVFQPSLFEKFSNSGSSDDTPIFILGMPRSGTTLCEQILASHPDVTGRGELRYIRDVIAETFQKQDRTFPNDINTLGEGELLTMADQYLAKLRENDQTSKHITDKLPGNFVNIGLINLILPKACIIHMKRNPMDTCLSIFTKSFAGHHPYAYDLTELGQYYRLYEKLMAHWHQVLPGAILDVSYEALTNNPEGEIRKLLDYCDLPFHEDCVNFHQSNRGVITESSTQVRQPMYTTATERWRHYKSELEPLRKALESAYQ